MKPVKDNGGNAITKEVEERRHRVDEAKVLKDIKLLRAVTVKAGGPD